MLDKPVRRVPRSVIQGPAPWRVGRALAFADVQPRTHRAAQRRGLWMVCAIQRAWYIAGTFIGWQKARPPPDSSLTPFPDVATLELRMRRLYDEHRHRRPRPDR